MLFFIQISIILTEQTDMRLMEALARAEVVGCKKSPFAPKSVACSCQGCQAFPQSNEFIQSDDDMYYYDAAASEFFVTDGCMNSRITYPRWGNFSLQNSPLQSFYPSPWQFQSLQASPIHGSPSPNAAASPLWQFGDERIADWRCLACVKAHQGSVFSLVLSGGCLYSSSEDDDIRIWRPADLARFGEFGTSHGAVKCIMAASDRLLTTHKDHKIRVWRLNRHKKFKHVASLPTVKDFLSAALLSKNYIQITRNKKCLWMQHFDAISALQLHPNASKIYSVSWDRTMKIWRAKDFKCLESIYVHDDAVNAVAVSRGGFVYTGSADKKVKVWEERRRKHGWVATLLHKSGVNTLALSSNEHFLYAGTSDGSIVVWNTNMIAKDSRAFGIMRGHRRAVLCVASIGNIICSGSADGCVRVWKREDGGNHVCIAALPDHNSPVKSLTLSMDSMGDCLVYTGTLDGHLRLWWISLNSNTVSPFQMGSPLRFT